MFIPAAEVNQLDLSNITQAITQDCSALDDLDLSVDKPCSMLVVDQEEDISSRSFLMRAAVKL